MERPERLDGQPTPLERAAERWLGVLAAAVYGFVGVGVLLGFGTVLHRSAYYAMAAFFGAALVAALLSVPLFYLTRIRGPRN